MSTPLSAPFPSQSRSRKKRPVDSASSFEDLLAAHKTERGPGQLPAEGVVLIGVDVELQRRMAERLGLDLPKRREPAQDQPRLLHSRAEFPQSPPSATASQEPADLVSSAPDIDAPNFSASVIGAPPQHAPISSALRPNAQNTVLNQIHTNPGALKLYAPGLPAPECGAPIFGAPAFDLVNLLIRRTGSKTYTVHPVSRIEDVFTSSERDLLRWLWEKGRLLPAVSKIRLLAGPNGEGARRLATQAGLIYNTFKNLTRSLSTKLAVDIIKPEKNLPTIYAVYHYSAILDRQRRAGFTGVIHKNGGGRDLVNQDAQPAIRRPDLTLEELEAILGAQKLGAPSTNIGAPNFTALSANFSAPNFGALLRNKEYTSRKESTSSSLNVGAPKIVLDSLFERTGRTDTDAARMITRGCLDANPTIQPEEIARLIRTAQIPPNIANPVGLLIRALPGRCTPESIANYREHWRHEEQQEQRRREQDRQQSLETARSILESVTRGEEWDASNIEWAKGILVENAPGDKQ